MFSHADQVLFLVTCRACAGHNAQAPFRQHRACSSHTTQVLVVQQDKTSIAGVARLWQDCSFQMACCCSVNAPVVARCCSVNAPIFALHFVKEVEPGHRQGSSRLQDLVAYLESALWSSVLLHQQRPAAACSSVMFYASAHCTSRALTGRHDMFHILFQSEDWSSSASCNMALCLRHSAVLALVRWHLG